MSLVKPGSAILDPALTPEVAPKVAVAVEATGASVETPVVPTAMASDCPSTVATTIMALPLDVTPSTTASATAVVCEHDGACSDDQHED